MREVARQEIARASEQQDKASCESRARENKKEGEGEGEQDSSRLHIKATVSPCKPESLLTSI
jgi:hypothetical protein